MADSIGFIGLGVMGAGMAKNIAAAGLPLVVTTSSPEKAEAFRAAGATVVATPREVAAAANIIVTCVPDADALTAVVAGENGLAAAPWDGLVIDCSTIAPFEAREIAAVIEAGGGAMIDAPVSGGAKGANDGTLTIMVGGADGDVARARPALEAMGKAIHHVGPLGAGQALKACNQLMVAVNLMGACEAVALARSAGVDPHVMREVLSTGAARSGVLEMHAKRYVDKALEGGFRAELMRKDLGIAAAVGSHEHRTQPATNLAHQMMTAACNAGFAKLDSAALGLLYDLMNGEPQEDAA
ncbi:NAD(P)-dependent oxidoreductase [Acuticoccus sp. M5D2P5]|uniref:NAD(P)-dependent oxidoreductase n=1 Tax=Acuticoccus kalidii TaxID=2910977 RepID=UPI001F447CB0|nr:NAD(P)-dependent oxidoreductase [Acuticoccus kalidii]MCF3933780.1 NAD(P)-dependent oxidoreductase [Acuticoccus kalidii]